MELHSSTLPNDTNRFRKEYYYLIAISEMFVVPLTWLTPGFPVSLSNGSIHLLKPLGNSHSLIHEESVRNQFFRLNQLLLRLFRWLWEIQKLWSNNNEQYCLIFGRIERWNKVL